jgi:hypothetical protein
VRFPLYFLSLSRLILGKCLKYWSWPSPALYGMHCSSPSSYKSFALCTLRGSCNFVKYFKAQGLKNTLIIHQQYINSWYSFVKKACLLPPVSCLLPPAKGRDAGQTMIVAS